MRFANSSCAIENGNTCQLTFCEGVSKIYKLLQLGIASYHHIPKVSCADESRAAQLKSRQHVGKAFVVPIAHMLEFKVWGRGQSF